jgi:hypothetical protein
MQEYILKKSDKLIPIFYWLYAVKIYRDAFDCKISCFLLSHEDRMV